MTKNKADNDNNNQKEKSIWQQVMDTVRPFTNNNIVNKFKAENYNEKTQTKKNHRNKHKVDSKQESSLSSEFSDMFENRPVTIDKTSFVKAQKELSVGDTTRLNRSQAKQLVSGKMSIDAVLDLHGNTQSVAFDRVFAFIKSSHARKHRKVKIITGKGKGVLQGEVPNWLNRPELSSLILSITHAQQKHGGSGALYVLLKRDKG